MWKRNVAILKDCPWKPLEAKPAASAQPAANIKFHKDGSVDVEQLKGTFGMALGAKVQDKRKRECDNIYHIAKVEADYITLIAADDSIKTLTQGEIIGSFVVRETGGGNHSEECRRNCY